MPFIGDIGPGELILVLVIALIVFGPGRLPEMGRQVGRAVREFRRMSSAATEEVTRALELDPAVAQSGSRASVGSSSAAGGVTEMAVGSGLEPSPYQPAAEPLRGAVPGMVFCAKCGAGTAETNNFCSLCGTSLKPSASSESPEVQLEAQPDEAPELHSEQPTENLSQVQPEKPVEKLPAALPDQRLEQPPEAQPEQLPDKSEEIRTASADSH